MDHEQPWVLHPGVVRLELAVRSLKSNEVIDHVSETQTRDLNCDYRVSKFSDAGNADGHLISCLERKRIWRHDAGAGQ